jgi:hypothetical protein
MLKPEPHKKKVPAPPCVADQGGFILDPGSKYCSSRILFKKKDKKTLYFLAFYGFRSKSS